jgi:VWFA-related protein
MARPVKHAVTIGLLALVVAGVRGDARPSAAQDAGRGGGQAAAPAAPPQQAPGQPDPATQQPPATEPQRPVFRAGVNFVRVDVIANDKSGRPVSDLTQNDFEITEGGRAQQIETFKRIDLDGGLMPGPDGPARQIRNEHDEESEAARDDVRLFGLFLDDYHTREGSSLSARDEVARFIETQLGPSDMIGTMYPLTPLDAVRFTRNHDAVRRGVQQFKGRKFDYQARNTIEEGYVCRVSSEQAESIRNDVSLSAIKAMIVRMGGLKEGRKALIVVSEGYSAMLPPQLRNPCACCGSAGNPNSQNPMAGTNSPIEERAAFSTGAAMAMDLRDVTDLANRNNVALYMVDPRGLATSEFDISENIGGQIDRGYLNTTMETLRTLAYDTDGRAIVNRNDLTMAMKQIVVDTSSYYLLGYSSTFTEPDGKFHEIKVRVKRPGVQLRARRGYWAMTRDNADRAAAIANPKPGPPKAVETALAAIHQPSRMRVIRTWIGNDRGADGRTKVSFVWEAVPRAPGDPSRSGPPARVSLTAVAPDGSPYFRGRVPDNAASRPLATFDAQPGKVQLRVSVEGGDGQVLDTEVREITVPDLTSQLVIGTPEVFRVRTAKELQQVKTDPQALPAVGREFSRTERLLIRLAAYGPGGASPSVSARLLNRAGQSMNDLPVVASASEGRSEIELALASIPPGEYLIEVTAKGGDSGEATELIAFRVTA